VGGPAPAPRACNLALIPAAQAALACRLLTFSLSAPGRSALSNVSHAAPACCAVRSAPTKARHCSCCRLGHMRVLGVPHRALQRGRLRGRRLVPRLCLSGSGASGSGRVRGRAGRGAATRSCGRRRTRARTLRATLWGRRPGTPAPGCCTSPRCVRAGATRAPWVTRGGRLDWPGACRRELWSAGSNCCVLAPRTCSASHVAIIFLPSRMVREVCKEVLLYLPLCLPTSARSMATTDRFSTAVVYNLALQGLCNRTSVISFSLYSRPRRSRSCS
jgi:hypothetical protein